MIDDDDDDDDDDDYQSIDIYIYIYCIIYILSSCWFLNDHDNNAPPVPTDGFSKLLGGGRNIFSPTG